MGISCCGKYKRLFCGTANFGASFCQMNGARDEMPLERFVSSDITFRYEILLYLPSVAFKRGSYGNLGNSSKDSFYVLLTGFKHLSIMTTLLLFYGNCETLKNKSMLCLYIYTAAPNQNLLRIEEKWRQISIKFSIHQTWSCYISQSVPKSQPKISKLAAANAKEKKHIFEYFQKTKIMANIRDL